MKRQQKGFTLIELIMVIVILGVLSAFALPRFADFGGDAEQASVSGARASVQSAAGIVRSAALVNNITSGSVDLEGGSVSTAWGYLAASGVEDAAELSDFLVATSGSNAYISIQDAGDDDYCFTFVEATEDDSPLIGSVSAAWNESDNDCDEVPS